MSAIAVTGAAGRLGGQVAGLLQAAGADVVALHRRPAAKPSAIRTRLADYTDRDALRRALEGVDTVVLISSDGEGTLVLHHHLNVLAAARECGVRHVVALSGVDADVSSPLCYAVTNGLTEQARTAVARSRSCAPHCSPSSSFAFCGRPGLLASSPFRRATAGSAWCPGPTSDGA